MNQIHKIAEDGLNCARCGAAITRVESEMFGGLCVECGGRATPPAPLLIVLNPPSVCFRCRTPGQVFEADGCLLCRACFSEWARALEALPAPLLQSEAERLHDEIVEATRQCNEWADRIDQLIEQRRLALGREAELAPPLNKHGLWGYDVRVEEDAE